MSDCVDPQTIIELFVPVIFTASLTLISSVSRTGPAILAFQFNWGLLGMLIVQVYNYYQASFRDNFAIKGLVYGLLLLELAQTALATHDAYSQFALSFGNYEGFISTDFLWLDVPTFIGISSGAIQCFYAWRIYVLGRSKVLSIGIAMVALMQFSAAVAEGILSAILRNQAAEQVKTPTTATIWLAGTASCDVIIACSMVYFLSRNRTGYKSTNRMINRLIRLVIETGMATAIVATLDLIFFLHYKHNYYHFVCALLLSKLYSNSLLVLLNNRVTLRQQAQLSESMPVGSMRFADLGTAEHVAGVNVNIDSHTYVDHVAMVNLTQTKDTKSDQLDDTIESSSQDIKV